MQIRRFYQIEQLIQRRFREDVDNCFRALFVSFLAVIVWKISWIIIKMRMINVTKKFILILWVIVCFVLSITQLLFTQNYAQRTTQNTEKSNASQVNEQQVSAVSIIGISLNDIFPNTILISSKLRNYILEYRFFSPGTRRF